MIQRNRKVPKETTTSITIIIRMNTQNILVHISTLYKLTDDNLVIDKIIPGIIIILIIVEVH